MEIMQGLHVATQVYFTTYEKLKAHMRKREGMPQPIQHMVSAVGAGSISSNLLLPTFAPERPDFSCLSSALSRNHVQPEA